MPVWVAISAQILYNVFQSTLEKRTSSQNIKSLRSKLYTLPCQGLIASEFEADPIYVFDNLSAMAVTIEPRKFAPVLTWLWKKSPLQMRRAFAYNRSMDYAQYRNVTPGSKRSQIEMH